MARLRVCVIGRWALTLLLLSRLVSADVIETMVGTGKRGFSGDGGQAVRAEINDPYGLAIGPGGELYFCDMANHRIRKVDRAGVIKTVAGDGTKGRSGDGGPATEAQLNEPYEVRFDKLGDMFFVEMRNHVVRRVDAKTGAIATIFGQGRAGNDASHLNQPHSIQFVNEHELWICDIGNHRVQAYDLFTKEVRTVGGIGQKGSTKEGAPLLGNPLNGPRAIDVARDGTVWLALREGNRIYRIEPRTRTVSLAAGTGSQGVKNGPALEATLSGPKGITVAKNGWIIWADTESHTIRYLDPENGTVHTLVGTGQRGDGPDGDPLKCQLARPHGVFADDTGFLWIGDSENHRVRRMKIE